MQNLRKIKAICQQSVQQKCGYLPEKIAVTKFIPITDIYNLNFFSILNLHGFRRSGEYIYRPDCPNCTACIPLRIPVEQFVASKSQKRCYRLNSDLSISLQRSKFTQEYYNLYEKYIGTRHAKGDMFPPSPQQFKKFLIAGSKWSNFCEFRTANQQLLMVTVIDILKNGIAAIYTFYDPEYSKRSLGTYSILWLINYAKKCHISHLYLGYWIESCEKMSYKKNFIPCELLKNEKWTKIENLH